jgi:hypothetical protein
VFSAGKYESMPVRTRLAGTNDKYTSPASFCFNWEDQTLWIDQVGGIALFFSAAAAAAAAVFFFSV